MDNASDLRLFLQESRSLAHRVHQSKSRLRRLAASVELDHGLASGTLKDVLKRIDNVMEWRFVNALGEVVLDGDILAKSIDCETLRTMRYCVAEYLKRIEEREAEDKSDE